MVLVDSSIWIEAARPSGDLLTKKALVSLVDSQEAALCQPVRLEVLGGARLHERSRLSAGLNNIPAIELDAFDWHLACLHNWQLRDAGVTLKFFDLLVGTLAIRHGIRAYARDRHFDQMADVLGLALYAPGPDGAFSPLNP